MWGKHGVPSRSRLALFFWLALSLAPAISWAADADPPGAMIYESELSRLVEISTRLATLNDTLKSELKSSKQSSEELALTLEISRIEAGELRKELKGLRTTSSELERSAELSATESAELRKSLTRAESSLTSLEASFGSYRTAAEGRIARLE